MMRRTINIILILISTLGYAQNETEIEVFRKIIDNEISNAGIFIRCEKPKTFFNSIEFKEQTGILLPENILEELTQSSNLNYDGKWNAKIIKDLNQKYSSDIIKKDKCLTLKDSERLYKKTGKRQSIVLISQPIFDSKFEYCIVSVSYLKFTGSAYGQKYLLKKVNGIWTIVIEYENWLS